MRWARRSTAGSSRACTNVSHVVLHNPRVGGDLDELDGGQVSRARSNLSVDGKQEFPVLVFPKPRAWGQSTLANEGQGNSAI